VSSVKRFGDNKDRPLKTNLPNTRMEPPGDKYFALFDVFPLRAIMDAEDFLDAEEFAEVLRTKLSKNQLAPDEVEYLSVLDLILEDYAEDLDTDLDDEDIFEPAGSQECGPPMTEIDHIVDELKDLLADKKKELQEWDFISLCNSLSTVISTKMAESETE
jgi:hypothetical protein